MKELTNNEIDRALIEENKRLVADNKSLAEDNANLVEDNKSLTNEYLRVVKELDAERRNETTIARRERDIHARVMIGLLYHEQTELWKALEVLSASQKRIKDALTAMGDRTDELYDFFTKQIDKVYEDEEEKGTSNE